MEALHVPVLPGAAWLDGERLDVAVSQPGLQGACDELAAVVAAQVGGCPSLGYQPFHDRDQVGRRELASDVQGEAFAAVLVQDREDAQLAAVVGAVADKVPAPDVVDGLRLGRNDPGGLTPSPGPLGPPLNPQPMLAPDARHELASDLPAFAA